MNKLSEVFNKSHKTLYAVLKEFFKRCLLCMWISSDTSEKTDAVCGPGSGRLKVIG